MAKLLRNYQSRHGLRTVREIISRWAPPAENPTEKYIAFVADKIDVEENEPIDVDEHMLDLLDAISHFEIGYQPYSDDVMIEGIRLAG